ncbi:MAG: hypothetical protein QM679_12110, partial [Patulibacter sp.]
PGALAITREFQLHDQFASPVDIELAEWVGKNTQTDDIFLTTDRSNQPVATLAGRTLVLGYRGWLYSYNIPYQEREQAVRTALSGAWNDERVTKFGAKYLVVSAYEDPSWSVNEQALGARTPVWSNSAWRVFQIK